MRIQAPRDSFPLLTLIRIRTIFLGSVYAEPGMYVCLCNGHRSSDIERTARDQNLTCPKAVYQALGGPVCCGTCLDVAQEIVDEVHMGATHLGAAHGAGHASCRFSTEAGIPSRRLMAAE